MYVPPHFSEPRAEALHELIETYPLGVLITNGKSGLDANHIPFELNKGEGQHGVLHFHVARANPVWQDVANGDEVLVVFRAPDAYVSPSWYPSKHEFKKQVPTWNYRVAHAHGRVTIRDDERYVRGMVARLTRTHEATQAAPWKMTDSPKEYIDMMLKAIVGMEIEITQLVGKNKLSQNREVRDMLNAGQILRSQGDTVIGDSMIAAGKNAEQA
jgi:transcriptional regulator